MPAANHFYRARLVKGGPFVGVKTFFGPPFVDGEEVDRSPRWQALVRTETTARAILMGDATPIEVDGVMLRNIEGIPEAEYRYLVAHADYSTKYAPLNPDAAPKTAFDLRNSPSIF